LPIQPNCISDQAANNLFLDSQLIAVLGKGVSVTLEGF